MAYSDLVANAARLREQLARADADLRDAQTNRPATPEQFAQMAAIQAKADAVYRQVGPGWVAPGAEHGETSLQYRRRLLRNLLPRAPQFKEYGDSLVEARHDALNAIEPLIFQDVEKEARRPTLLEPGELRSVTRQDSTGRDVTEFFGDVSQWIDEFRAPKRHARIVETERRR